MLHFNCLTAAHTLSYKPLVGQWTTCLVSLLCCHLVYRLPSSSRYTARLSSDVVFTGVARQRCQSCLLFLSNQRASARVTSARFGSTRHGKEKHRGGGVYRVMCRPRHNMLSVVRTMETTMNKPWVQDAKSLNVKMWCVKVLLHFIVLCKWLSLSVHE
jgi:hypothetical protein